MKAARILSPKSWHLSRRIAGLLILLLETSALAAMILFARWRPGFSPELGSAVGAFVLYQGAGVLLFLMIRFAMRRPKDFLLLMLSVLMTVGLIEAALRIVQPYRSHMWFRWVDSRRLHHIAPANRTMFKKSYEGEPMLIKTNEDGLRTQYSRAQFTKFAERIVAMGDSYTYGFSIQQGYTFPEVMEEMLRQRLCREDIGVLNAGIVSYSPFLASNLFADVIVPYKPALVLYALDATDFGDDYFYAQQARYDENGLYFDLENQQAYYYGALGEAVYHNVTNSGLRVLLDWISYPRDFFEYHVLGQQRPSSYYAFSVTVDGERHNSRYFIYRHPVESLLPFFEATRKNVDHLAAQVREAGGTFVLLVLPRFHHWNPKESPDYWERNEYSVNEPYQFAYLDYFDSIRDSLDYPVFNLLPAFKSTDQYPLTFREDAHWNRDGNAFVARIVAEYLLEHYPEQLTSRCAAK